MDLSLHVKCIMQYACTYYQLSMLTSMVTIMFMSNFFTETSNINSTYTPIMTVTQVK